MTKIYNSMDELHYIMTTKTKTVTMMMPDDSAECMSVSNH